MKAFDQSKEDASSDLAALLADALSDSVSSRQVAGMVASAFRGMDQALVPIIGQRGLAALYKRSVHLASRDHAWLPGSREGVSPPPAMDVTALTSELSQQTPAAAAAAGGQLLQTFCELLISLIGPSLTDRLLRPVWATLLSGAPAQETTP
jgi:hypothetical protein